MRQVEFPSFEELVDAKHSAIIVVDMQNDFCSEKSARRKGADLSAVKQTAQRLGQFLTQARNLGIKLIHVCTTCSDSTDSPAWVRVLGDFVGRICEKGTWGAEWFEEVETLRPKAGEYVVEKHRYSAFVGTELDLVLKSIGVKTVIITGTATDVCVHSTIRDALMHDYHVVVVEDCVASSRLKLHEATLEIVKIFFGTLSTSQRLLEVWSQKRSARN